MSKRIRIVKGLGVFGVKAGTELDIELSMEGEEMVLLEVDERPVKILLSHLDPSFYEFVRWKPKHGEGYLAMHSYLDSDGGIGVVAFQWTGSRKDIDNYELGNVFPETPEGRDESSKKHKQILEVLKT
jgi:hypothetical protein